LAAVADGQARLILDETVRARLRRNAACGDRMATAGHAVYGLNTGFGPLACHAIDAAAGVALQRRLIHHLCTGVGPLYSRREVRAILATRIVNLAQGWSGLAPEPLEWLSALLEHDLIPAVPQWGTVGASGDLAPLAHLALAALGEGELLTDTPGVTQPARPAFAAAGIAPLALTGRIGLALVNGTAAMTALAALNGVALRLALDRAFSLTILYGELLHAHRAAWHPRLAVARPHPGQRAASERLFADSADSRCLQSLDSPPRADGLPQDCYTLRCAPQELGAALDVLAFHDRIVTDELNAASDNPLIDDECMTVWHGGNFYGQHIAYAADGLSLVVAKLATFAERAVARLTDATLNQGLPPFLTGARPGLDSGLMGVQVAATALTAELRAQAAPATLHSLPTNANNQDVVTLGTIAARRCRDALALLWRVLAIEALAVAQGLDLRLRAGARYEDFCARSRALHALVRAHAAPLDTDRPLSDDIERLAAALQAP